MRIRIIYIPNNVCPEEIIKTVIGMELESLGKMDQTMTDLCTLLRRPNLNGGYRVCGKVLEKALEERSKEAHRWWLKNRGKQTKEIVFLPNECEELPLTWDDVLKCKDIVGGEIATYGNEFVYSGSISAIKLENNQVCIETLWMARIPLNSIGGWAYWRSFVTVRVSIETMPKNLGDGSVGFDLPLAEWGIIIPKDSSRLNLTRVKGIGI